MRLYPSFSDDLAAWALRQPVFFTATAPTHADHVNVSPKGLPASHLAVLDPNTVAYIDRTGSGCETIAHAYENGRLTFLFISFGPSPRILRLFCRAKVVEFDDPAYEALATRITSAQLKTAAATDDVNPGVSLEGARAVIIGHIYQVQTSCGYGVPMVRKQLYASASSTGESLPLPSTPGQSAEGGEEDETSVFEDRPTLDTYWNKRAAEGTVGAYQRDKNATSIDGLPGLRAARRAAGEWLWVTDGKARLRRAVKERDGVVVGFALAVFLYCILALAFPDSAVLEQRVRNFFKLREI